MSLERHSSARPGVLGRASFAFIGLLAATLIILPATALAQATGTPGAGTPVAGATATAPATAVATALTLSAATGTAGASITANGVGYKPTETVDVTFNGQPVGTPLVNSGGSFSLAFTVPAALAPGQYAVLATGRNSGMSATTAFTVKEGAASLVLSVPQAVPGTSLTVTGSGFQPGEVVQVWFNGATVGSETADTKGGFTASFPIPTLAPGSFDLTATGASSAFTVTVPFTVLAAPAAAATAVPAATATPVPAAAPAPVAANAPAMAHDDRYYPQTGYRIDDDNVWAFFNQYGKETTFGFPVSRMMSFKGCPVQMFQRLIIQVCPGSGPALINMLDPDIFPYTQVNGSTFPAADSTIKANTPPVTSPSYSTDILSFIQTTVPDTFNGQPVNFNQTFNGSGGLTIWGAPISAPQADPANGNFIYQRFQRGIMHFTVGTGTQSILLADYLKAILMNQNVPTDLAAQSRETQYFNQYCPTSPLWLCRANDLPGTDLTYAFEKG